MNILLTEGLAESEEHRIAGVVVLHRAPTVGPHAVLVAGVAAEEDRQVPHIDLAGLVGVLRNVAEVVVMAGRTPAAEGTALVGGAGKMLHIGLTGLVGVLRNIVEVVVTAGRTVVAKCIDLEVARYRLVETMEGLGEAYYKAADDFVVAYNLGVVDDDHVVDQKAEQALEDHHVLVDYFAGGIDWGEAADNLVEGNLVDCEYFGVW